MTCHVLLHLVLSMGMMTCHVLLQLVPSKCMIRCNILLNKRSRYMNNKCLMNSNCLVNSRYVKNKWPLEQVMHKLTRTCPNGKLETKSQSR